MKVAPGISCLRCGGKTEVLATRDSGSGIRRRRACLTAGCGGRVSTLEMVVPHGSAIDARQLALVEVKAMKRAIGALALLEQQLACVPAERRALTFEEKNRVLTNIANQDGDQ